MSVITPPQAPRAMNQQQDTTPPAVSFEPVFEHASKTLYPRLALFEALSEFKDDHERRRKSKNKICEARRDFLDSFAYLCDVKKGGATVTAAALRKIFGSNILYLAANEGVREDVRRYAEIILQKLKFVTPETRRAIQNDIFQLAVEKCTARIVYYRDEMQKYGKKCLQQLTQGKGVGTVTSLQTILTIVSSPLSGMKLADIVDLFYKLRGANVDEIKERSQDPGDDFSRLAHYIGRLGATRASADTVVRAMLEVPGLRDISEIWTMPPPEIREVTVGPENLSPYEIVWAMCKEDQSRNPLQTQSALHAIVDLDIPLDSTIRSGLASRRTIVTRVHAELQLADKFSRDQYKFMDDDKYIGCSKPACYFCYSWLCSHKHRYAAPATHHKIIVGCRGPDNGINQSGAAVLNEMYNKVGRQLNQDILDFLLNSQHGGAHRRHQFQSTEGSSQAPSQV